MDRIIANKKTSWILGRHKNLLKSDAEINLRPINAKIGKRVSFDSDSDIDGEKVDEPDIVK